VFSFKHTVVYTMCTQCVHSGLLRCTSVTEDQIVKVCILLAGCKGQTRGRGAPGAERTSGWLDHSPQSHWTEGGEGWHGDPGSSGYRWSCWTSWCKRTTWTSWTQRSEGELYRGPHGPQDLCVWRWVIQRTTWSPGPVSLKVSYTEDQMVLRTYVFEGELYRGPKDP